MNRFILALAAAAALIGCVGPNPSGATTLTLTAVRDGQLRFRSIDGRSVSRSSTQLNVSPGPHQLVVGLDDQLGQRIGSTLLGGVGSQLGRALDLMTTPANDQSVAFYAYPNRSYLVRCTHVQGQQRIWVEEAAR